MTQNKKIPNKHSPTISCIFFDPSEIFDHEPLVLKATSTTAGISLKQALQINEKKTIMNEVKNMLDYKVGHYIIEHKFFPNGDMDKLKLN